MNLSQTNTAALHLVGVTPAEDTALEQSDGISLYAGDIDPLLSEPGVVSTRPELLVAAVLHLMSHYTTHRQEGACIKLASVIERHLKILGNLHTMAPVLRATCLQLSGQWADIVDQAIAKPKKRGLMTRLLAGAHD